VANPQEWHNSQQADFFTWVESGDRASGLSLAPVDESVRAHLKLPKGQGLIATSVVPHGPAAQAGISQNDILLTLDEAPLGKPEDLEERLKAAGDKPLGLVLLHHGEKKTLQVQPRIKVTFGPVQPEPPAFWIGVSVAPVEPALRAQLRIPADQGLIATEVIADSPAAKAGLKVNDILLSMAGKPLKEQATLVDLVQKNGDKSVAVEILREGAKQTIEVTPQRRKTAKFTARLHAPGAVRWNFVRPGIVLPGQESGIWGVDFDEGGNSHIVLQDPNHARANPPQPQADALSKRLDGMSAEIQELRKAIDELAKALRDRR
jgi:membrane-associated protease RseP (regulator of RpoE activity)